MADASWWRELGQMDDEQRKVVDLPKSKNFLVLGPPGSGKTNLLLLRAQHLVNGGRPNLCVLMFTKTLKKFVMRGGQNYGFSADKVQTFFAWENSILREHGVRVDSGKPFPEYRVELAQRLKELFDARPGLEHQIECVLVDEVQDALPEEIDLFMRAAKNVFFVGDSRQAIYQSNATVERITSDPDVVVHKLTYHYRNGRKICAVADAIGAQMGEPPMLDTCNYVEKNNASSAVFEACAGEDEQFEKLTARLTNQLAAFPDELLGVACARREDAGALRARLAGSDLNNFICAEDEVFDPFRPDARIFVCTIHDAKGLEFRTMHLPFAERVKVFRDRQKRVSYTAITRAKTALSVYSTETLPAHLEQAREVTIGPRPEPSMTDLFPPKKH